MASALIVEGRQVEFETCACNYCGSSDVQLLFEGPDRLLGLPGLFRLVTCQTCGLIRQNPRPTLETIEAYYPPAYEPYSQSIERETKRLRRLDRRYGMIKRRRIIERHQRGGVLLDVGSASGNFLAEMASTGVWKTVGIEPNEHAASVAAENQRLEIHVGTLETVEFAPERFDVVTLWNVLEHLHAPIDDLRRVARLLRPGGLLVFSIPNLESLEVRLFGDAWIGWDLPRHLYLFPANAVRQICGELGFEIAEVVALSGSQLSFALTLEHLFPAGQARPFWYTPFLRLLKSMFGRVLLMPFFYGIGLARQSTILTYVARKR